MSSFASVSLSISLSNEEDAKDDAGKDKRRRRAEQGREDAYRQHHQPGHDDGDEEEEEEDDDENDDDVMFRTLLAVPSSSLVVSARLCSVSTLDVEDNHHLLDDDDGGGGRDEFKRMEELAYRRLRPTVDRLKLLLIDEAGGAVLVEGPAGCGKSTACRLALQELESSNVVCVTLRGYLSAHVDICLRSLLKGLGGAENGESGRNQSETRLHLHRRLVTLASEGKLVVIFLEQAEVFAKEPRQPLLYLLNDLTHEPSVRIKLLLSTQGQGFEEALEKRIASRLSRTRLAIPHLTLDAAESIVLYELRRRGVAREAFRRLQVRDALDKLLQVNCTDVRNMVKLAWLVQCHQGVHDEIVNALFCDLWKLRLSALSEVEMCVLVAVVSKNKSDFTLAFEEYRREMAAAEFPVMDRRLFWRAYCSLLDSGTLEAPPHVIRNLLQNGEESRWPTYLCRWGGQWLA